MQKSELKSGMVVQYKNGDERIVMLDTEKGDALWSFNEGGFAPRQVNSLRSYEKDLNDQEDYSLSIVKVFNNPKGRTLLWETPKPYEISREDVDALIKRTAGLLAATEIIIID